MQNELDNIQQRYQRRDGISDRYNPLLADVTMARQEKERAIIGWLNHAGFKQLSQVSLLEIGCGNGSNLLGLLQLGFLPENLIANELLPERVEAARKRLPQAIRLLEGDASRANFDDRLFDIVYQSTVFSSILDRDFQQVLAQRMWQLLKPGGWILWYDFVYNNPNNKDVIGVPYSRIRSLFPDGQYYKRRVTLAPPIARIVTRLHPSFYTLFNNLPFLRTHVLCGIQKPT